MRPRERIQDRNGFTTVRRFWRERPCYWGFVTAETTQRISVASVLAEGVRFELTVRLPWFLPRSH
jgi:hypothetical protein